MEGITKQCTACKEVKSLEGFYKKSSGTYGLDSKCKKCVLKLKHKQYLFKLKAKSGEVILIEDEENLIPDKAILIFLKMQGRS